MCCCCCSGQRICWKLLPLHNHMCHCICGRHCQSYRGDPCYFNSMSLLQSIASLLPMPAMAGHRVDATMGTIITESGESPLYLTLFLLQLLFPWQNLRPKRDMKDIVVVIIVLDADAIENQFIFGNEKLKTYVTFIGFKCVIN